MADSHEIKVGGSINEVGDTPKTDVEPSGPTTAKCSFVVHGSPVLYVIPSRLPDEELRQAEETLTRIGGVLTHDINEERIIFVVAATPKRAKFELRVQGLGINPPELPPHVHHEAQRYGRPERKRTRLTKSGEYTSSSPRVEEPYHGQRSDASGSEDFDVPAKPMSQLSVSNLIEPAENADLEALEIDNEASQNVFGTFGAGQVKVLKLDWLSDSLAMQKPLNIEPYLLLEGIPALLFGEQKLSDSHTKVEIKHEVEKPTSQPTAASDLHDAARHESQRPDSKDSIYHRIPGTREKNRAAVDRDLAGRAFVSTSKHHSPKKGRRPPQLIRETSSDHEKWENVPLPEMPDWIKQKKLYACERTTLDRTPNDDFVALVEKIKKARTLTGDQVGVRAYSTIIASLRAYPHVIRSSKEILAIPGCDDKVVRLWQEYHASGNIQAAKDVDSDPVLSVLQTFYDIYDVGATTAREFYYDEDKRWRTIDDIVEHGWNILSRNQQLGVKYYDEFLQRITRPEVEFIASVVTYHAKQLVDEGIETIVVGGYRRGKVTSGDVDIILSHRRESATFELITHLLYALETFGYVTHTLSLHTTNSSRDQQPLPLKSLVQGGHGFDTLDKALCIWQDPIWPTRDQDLAENPNTKNPNIHRRVDIIISPWRTLGCAIMGWTSGTTFQRDLRRYAKYKKKWKFDSSGVRDRVTGKWIDLEKGKETWQDKERAVMEGMGLEWREPWERCTG